MIGDFNAGYRADAHVRLPKLPYRRLKRLHLNSMWQGTKYVRQRQGTHRDALIDQVWSKRKARRAKVLRWVEPSDHYDLVFNVTGDSAHGFVDVKIAGAYVGTKYGEGDFLVDLSTFYDDDPTTASVRPDFQGDMKSEPDVAFTIQLVETPTATVTLGQGTANGTMTDDD